MSLDKILPKLIVISGAGISAQSGLKTFRDADGLWEGHDIMEVASPAGWHRNKALVLDFYNQRRRQLKEVSPNEAHLILQELEAHFDVSIITQNVDDLHERAGSAQILHLHGSLLSVRSTLNEATVLPWTEDLNLGDCCKDGTQLRPDIVWFGEAVPLLEKAASIISRADIVLIIGTSLQVYPAAGLVSYAPISAEIIYIDPRPRNNASLSARNVEVIEEDAINGMHLLRERWKNQKG